MANDRSWRTIKNGKDKYAAYLCSREWGVLREAVHQRAKGRCEKCFINKIDAVHHLTYARKYKERLEDLQGVCNRCHEFEHGRCNDDPELDIYRPEIGTNPSFPALAIIVCPICQGRLTTISGGRQEFFGGVDLFTLDVKCASDDGEIHLFEMLLVPYGQQTAITTKNFRVVKT